MTTATSDISSQLGASTPAVAPGVRARLAGLYELTKPRLNFLVIITTAVGCYLAAGAAGLLDRPWLFLNTLIGTALTAGGAGALNQFLEREYDALMPRTSRRPLPSGLLPAGVALGLGLGLGAAGTALLALLVNPLTAGLGLFTLLSYVLIYTPLKRRTWLNTLVGAVPGAIPPMMGVAAFENALTPTAWALFGILFVWQMPHFFGLALLYRDDYARGGYAMLPACRNGVARTARQAVVFLALLVPAALMPTLVGAAGWWYAAASLALGVWFLNAGLAVWRSPGKAEARRLFLTSILYLPLLLIVMMLDKA